MFSNEERANVQFWDCTFDKEYENIEESKSSSCQDDQSLGEQHDTSERIDHLILILGYFFKVDKKTRKMSLISRLRQEVNIDDKSLRKSLNYLQANKMIIINGDKSFITDDGVSFYSSAKK